MTALFRLITLFILFALFGSGQAVAAQNESPTLTVAAGGLINPRGFSFDATGQLIVAEAGTGGEQLATDPVPSPTGPHSGGPTGRVSRIEIGCPIPIATGLPSARSPAGETIGPAAIVIFQERILVLNAGGGASHGNDFLPAGIYDITNSDVFLVADLSTWLRNNPVDQIPESDLDPDGSWYSMIADPATDTLLVVESNSEQVLRVSLDGTITRLADLSGADMVPTAIALGPDGTIYVGHFTPAPFTAGSATVLKINPDGTSEQVWTGLSMITGLAVDASGVLYVAEFSDSRDEPPFFVPGTGRVVRQTGPDTNEVVIDQLNFPTAIQFGPDGTLYVSLPAVGADTGTGEILRAEITASLPLLTQDFDLTPPSCVAGATETLVKVSDLGIDPSTVTIPVGGIITWRNTGEFDHAIASDADSAIQWDSGILRPGDEFTQTFDQPGTYRYFDGLFTTNTAEIVVTEA